MSKGFNPGIGNKNWTAIRDPDADWMALAEKLPLSSQRSAKPKPHYIPAIPWAFLKAALPARDALPILLIALAKMRMQRTDEIALGPAIWQEVGNPSKRVRIRLLCQLGKLPPSLCTLIHRKGRPYLLKAGLEWPRPLH